MGQFVQATNQMNLKDYPVLYVLISSFTRILLTGLFVQLPLIRYFGTYFYYWLTKVIHFHFISFYKSGLFKFMPLLTHTGYFLIEVPLIIISIIASIYGAFSFFSMYFLIFSIGESPETILMLLGSKMLIMLLSIVTIVGSSTFVIRHDFSLIYMIKVFKFLANEFNIFNYIYTSILGFIEVYQSDKWPAYLNKRI